MKKVLIVTCCEKFFEIAPVFFEYHYQGEKYEFSIIETIEDLENRPADIRVIFNFLRFGPRAFGISNKEESVLLTEEFLKSHRIDLVVRDCRTIGETLLEFIISRLNEIVYFLDGKYSEQDVREKTLRDFGHIPQKYNTPGYNSNF